MAAKHASGARTRVGRAAAFLSAGAVVAALNFSGLGAPEPAFTSSDTADRPFSASRSLSDRLDVQPGITVDGDSDPFLQIATAEAVAGKPEAGEPADGSVCISSPLPAGAFRISSNYGMRTNPVTGGHGLHAGVDLAAAFGTPIHAVASGTVAYTGAGRAGRSSELVIIDHEVDGTKFSSWYVHMYPDGVFVEAGQKVRAGEIIAEVGSNGFSTGPHLHLEIHTEIGVAGGKGTAIGRILSTAIDPHEIESGDDKPPPVPGPSPTSSQSPTPSPKPSPSAPLDPEGDEDGEDVEEPAEGDEDPDPTDDALEGEEEENSDQDTGTEAGGPTEKTDSDPASEETSGQRKVEDIEIEEDDDGGKNDHTIDDTVSRSTGVFDPSSLGVLHDPLPFLRGLGYGLASPSSCLSD